MEALAGKDAGGASGPPLRIEIRSVETTTVKRQEMVGGRLGHVPVDVEVAEERTREVEVEVKTREEGMEVEDRAAV